MSNLNSIVPTSPVTQRGGRGHHHKMGCKCPLCKRGGVAPIKYYDDGDDEDEDNDDYNGEDIDYDDENVNIKNSDDNSDFDMNDILSDKTVTAKKNGLSLEGGRRRKHRRTKKGGYDDDDYDQMEKGESTGKGPGEFKAGGSRRRKHRRTKKGGRKSTHKKRRGGRKCRKTRRHRH